MTAYAAQYYEANITPEVIDRACQSRRITLENNDGRDGYMEIHFCNQFDESGAENWVCTGLAWIDFHKMSSEEVHEWICEELISVAEHGDEDSDENMMYWAEQFLAC